MKPDPRTGARLETLRRCALVALFALASGCAALPCVSFTGEEAGASDSGAHDSSVEGGAHADAGDVDAGDVDAGNPLACLPPGAPAKAACCSPTMPCAGMACNYCNDCSQLDPACTPTQYCCATVNGNGKYKGVSCSANGAKCP
jgi:hypothetical protein